MDAHSDQVTRRSVLRRISMGIGGAVLVFVDPLRVSAGGLGGLSSGSQLADQEAGQIWGQLRLLPLGAIARPAPQRMQVTAPPILEQLPGGVPPTGTVREITETEFRALGIRTYRAAGAQKVTYLGSFTAGKLYQVSTVSVPPDPRWREVTVVCQPDYELPYPVLTQGTPEHPVEPEKTLATPAHGVMFRSAWEITGIWAEDGGLFRAVAVAAQPDRVDPDFEFTLESA